MELITASTIEEYCKVTYDIQVGFRGRFPWWRGHANTDWMLTPSLYHKGKAQVETSMARDFMNKASARHYSLPSFDDLSGWLFLMQHYGLPTRLLDWSASPLVALHFATCLTEDTEDNDACIWGLDSGGLNNSQYGTYGIASPTQCDYKTIVDAAIKGPSESGLEKTLAIESKQIDLRHMVQMAEYTIHGSETPLDGYPNSDQFLVKIVIPKQSKRDFRRRLQSFGITEAYLFPDLQHLAKQVQAQSYNV